MTSTLLDVVRRFAKSLDDEDYETLARLLADGCEYASPKGLVLGRDGVLASYRAAAESAKSIVDRIAYESMVRSDGEDAIVTFVDHLDHHGVKHTYACEQAIRVNADGLIYQIVHRELPGQRDALRLFLLRIETLL